MMGGNKMKYEKPYIELIDMNEDIITASLEEDMDEQIKDEVVIPGL